ncbi:hypothetical protein [Nitrosomonas mobilis]|uniref:Uncharacterized protein n=1 Tax=Nitrosomonas mobilis TaxID=51642 RepID=A0A1G5SCV4_9PROT|nr:hypothetical protein [Nitrosomonas mobilis]SCZ84371.1 hypothetical protein NSMM_150109 [Nitrosomonas mobilis]
MWVGDTGQVTRKAETLRTELTSTLQTFSKSILESEAGIATAVEDKREQAV